MKTFACAVLLLALSLVRVGLCKTVPDDNAVVRDWELNVCYKPPSRDANMCSRNMRMTVGLANEQDARFCELTLSSGCDDVFGGEVVRFPYACANVTGKTFVRSVIQGARLDASGDDGRTYTCDLTTKSQRGFFARRLTAFEQVAMWQVPCSIEIDESCKPTLEHVVETLWIERTSDSNCHLHAFGPDIGTFRSIRPISCGLRVFVNSFSRDRESSAACCV
jgi:hypothetical protein